MSEIRSSSRMRVIHVKAENFLSLEDYEIEPGAITVFEGENGSGKTSRLRAMAAAFEPSGLSQIKRVGAGDETARIVVTLKDDNGRRTIVERNEKGVKVKQQVVGTDGKCTAAFKATKRPADFIASILPNGTALNPMTFLNANDKIRVDMLLDALPVEFDADHFWDTVGITADDEWAGPTQKNAIYQIDHYRRLVFERRTGINVSQKAKKAACEEIRMSVPFEIPSAPNLREKEESLASLRSQHAAGVERINADANTRSAAVLTEIETAEQSATDRVEAIKKHADDDAKKRILANQTASGKCLAEKLHDSKTEIASLKNRIDAIEKEIEAREDTSASAEAEFESRINLEAEQLIAATQEEIAAHLHNARNKAQTDIARIHIEKEAATEENDQLNPQIDSVLIELGEIEEQLKNVERIRADHERADQYEAESNELLADSKLHTEALTRIDRYKADLIRDLPIKGVDIKDGVILVDGVTWKTVNTGRQLGIAVSVICMQLGDAPLRLVFVDGAEELDEKSQFILEQEILSHNAQAVIARVTNDQEVQTRKVS